MSLKASALTPQEKLLQKRERANFSLANHDFLKSVKPDFIDEQKLRREMAREKLQSLSTTVIPKAEKTRTIDESLSRAEKELREIKSQASEGERMQEIASGSVLLTELDIPDLGSDALREIQEMLAETNLNIAVPSEADIRAHSDRVQALKEKKGYSEIELEEAEESQNKLYDDFQETEIKDIVLNQQRGIRASRLFKDRLAELDKSINIFEPLFERSIEESKKAKEESNNALRLEIKQAQADLAEIEELIRLYDLIDPKSLEVKEDDHNAKHLQQIQFAGLYAKHCLQPAREQIRNLEEQLHLGNEEAAKGDPTWGNRLEQLRDDKQKLTNEMQEWWAIRESSGYMDFVNELENCLEFLSLSKEEGLSTGYQEILDQIIELVTKEPIFKSIFEEEYCEINLDQLKKDCPVDTKKSTAKSKNTTVAPRVVTSSSTEEPELELKCLSYDDLIQNYSKNGSASPVENFSLLVNWLDKNRNECPSKPRDFESMITDFGGACLEIKGRDRQEVSIDGFKVTFPLKALNSKNTALKGFQTMKHTLDALRAKHGGES
jgi:hypothetical protein